MIILIYFNNFHTFFKDINLQIIVDLLLMIIIIRFIHDASGLLANSHRKSCSIYINSYIYIFALFLYSEKLRQKK